MKREEIYFFFVPQKILEIGFSKTKKNSVSDLNVFVVFIKHNIVQI